MNDHSGVTPVNQHTDPERITPRSIAIVLCATVCTAMFAFSWNSVTVALPYMQGSFSATTDQIAWVIIAYVIGASVVTGCTGWLSIRFGRKRLFLFSIAGFVVTLVGCGMATTLWEEVFWRFAQGLVAAPMMPIGQSIAVAAFPRTHHTQATSLWALGFVTANVISPVIGGFLIENWGWQWIFFAVIPVGIVGFVMSWILVPSSEPEKRRLDWLGFASLVIGVGVLQLVLARGARLDWFSSTEIIIETVVTLLALYIFIVHTLTGRDTFVDRRMFLDRNFAMGQALIFPLGAVMFLPVILLPLLLQQIGGYPAVEVGYLMLPRGLGSIIGLSLMSRLRERFDPRLMLIFGLIGVAWPSWEMGHWNADVPAWEVTWTTFIQGMSIAFIWAPLNALTLSRLERRTQDQGYALFYLFFDVGSSVGTAAVIGVQVETSQISHEELNTFITPFNELLRAPFIMGGWNMDSVEGLLMIQGEIMRQASMIGYNNAFLVVAGVLFLAVPCVIGFRKPRALD